MKKYISEQDLEALAIGVAILGSGGGGDSHYEKLMTSYAMQQHGSVPLITIDDITEDDLIVPICFMGAPLVEIEKISSGREFEGIFARIEQIYGKKPTVLMPAEIGGGNALVPFRTAGEYALPVLDADLIGRAFPELQMNSAHLAGLDPSPAFIADALQNCTMIDVNNTHALEKIGRAITVAVGSSAALTMYVMQKDVIASAVVSGSVSRALTIGHTILDARHAKEDPIVRLVHALNGCVVGSGVISDIDQSIQGGFLKGNVIVRNKSGTVIVVQYQNEYLLAWCNEAVIATTPDIIMLLEAETGAPITTESLCYGLNVCVVALPAPALWQSEKALQLVGPGYFGYTVDYKPIRTDVYE